MEVAQPVPGVQNPVESQQSRRGWSNPRAWWRVMGWHSSTEPLSLEQCSEELESWLWPTGETSDGQGSISVL